MATDDYNERHPTTRPHTTWILKSHFETLNLNDDMKN